VHPKSKQADFSSFSGLTVTFNAGRRRRDRTGWSPSKSMEKSLENGKNLSCGRCLRRWRKADLTYFKIWKSGDYIEKDHGEDGRIGG